MGRAPSAKDVHGTMMSAIGATLEGMHELPEGVLLAYRDRGKCGQASAYYAYCYRCRAWLDFSTALTHTSCSGWHWDKELADVEWKWWWEIQQMRDRVRNGVHPYYDGIQDYRNHDAAPGSAFPALVAGQRQVVRAPIAEGLGSRLDVMVDIPALDSDGVGACDGSVEPAPLNVLVYFHGQGENYALAPRSCPGLAVVAVHCPSYSREGIRCFWFTEGSGGDWDRHRHENLRRCQVMLTAVATLLDGVLEGLMNGFGPRVRRKVLLLGVSMGGRAVLEFARAFPARVCGAAVVAGLYNDAERGEVLRATAQIPLLFVHSREDGACPFRSIEQLVLARCAAGADGSGVYAETEAWFSDGYQHTRTEGEMMEIIRWLLRHA